MGILEPDTRSRNEPPSERESPRRARAAVAIAAATISDRTCLEVCGIEPKPWRAMLDELRIPHVRLHRRTICRTDDWTAAIDRLTGRTAPVWDRATIVRLAAASAK